MKKNFKFYFAFILMALLLCTTNVYAVSKMSITEKSYIRTNFSDGTYRNEAYFSTNKGVAYCITPKKTGAPQGTSLSYNKTVNSGSILYLLNNAGNSKDNYLVTQLAIWKVAENYVPASYNKDTQLMNRVNKLASTAKSNSNFSTNPTMKLSSSSLSFSESSDGNYYISNYITITSNDMNKIVASISEVNGAVITSNKKSGASLTLTNGSKFNVKIPKSSITSNTNIKVTVKATGINLSYQRYTGGNWQDLVVLVKTPKNVSMSVNGNVTPVVHKCEYKNGKYYDKNGNITDKTTYSIQCEKHTCEKVGNTYFGKDGKVTDEDDYNLQCKTHTCEKVGDTYFGKDGKVTDEDGYNLQCKTHTCEKVGDTYFGKDGKVTDEDGYNLQCKTHSCEVINNKFFGKNGNEITEDEYNLQCKTHTCEIVGNKYFDENGNETDPDTYKKQCEMVIEVPNTSDSDNLVFTVLGIITITGAVLIIKKF